MQTSDRSLMSHMHLGIAPWNPLPQGRSTAAYALHPTSSAVFAAAGPPAPGSLPSAGNSKDIELTDLEVRCAVLCCAVLRCAALRIATDSWRVIRGP